MQSYHPNTMLKYKYRKEGKWFLLYWFKFNIGICSDVYELMCFRLGLVIVSIALSFNDLDLSSRLQGLCSKWRFLCSCLISLLINHDESAYGTCWWFEECTSSAWFCSYSKEITSYKCHRDTSERGGEGGGGGGVGAVLVFFKFVINLDET